MHQLGLRRVEQSAFFKVIEGQDTTKKSYDIDYKAEVAQNCRFGDEVGSVTKRSLLAFYNGTEELNGSAASPIDSIYRYYKQSDGTQYLLQLNNNLLRVGNDSAGTFSTLKTFSSSAGKRFNAVTYQDLAIISTGYDDIVVTDGLAAWELGSCKATLKAEAGNVNAGAHYYAVTFSNSTGGVTVRTGSATSTTADKLVDSTANFGAESTPTEEDMVVEKTTDADDSDYAGGDWSIITAIDSTTTLSLNNDIFESGDTYSIDIATTSDVVNGAKSNTVTTTAGSGKVTLSNIPLGPTNCTSRDIYRTAAGGSELKLLTTITDNSTTTYEDNIADASLGSTMPAVTDDIPKGKYLHVTDERLFVSGDPSNGSYIYFSDQYRPHYFVAVDGYDIIGQDEGDVITGVKDLLGQTYIFKQNSIRPYYINGLPATWSQGKIVSVIGCPVPYSIANIPTGIVYQGWDHMYLFNGQYSQAILDEFNIAEEILEVRMTESVGYFWNNLYLLAYTDLDDANGYHDRVLVWDVIRNQHGIDKGGAITSGTGNTQVNCFTAMKGHSEWGQLYAGDSNRGFVYQYDRIINAVYLSTKTDIDLGTHTSTMAVGEEINPILTKLTLDNMETYTTDDLAQEGWVTSETTEKMPPDLGTGLDGTDTIAADVTWASDKNYIDCTINAGVTVTVNGTVYIKCQGTFTNNGTISIDAGSTLYLWGFTITNSATGVINGNLSVEANTLNNAGTMANDLIKTATHAYSGGTSPTSGYDGDWGTAHTDTYSGTSASLVVEEWHTLSTTATVSSVKWKASSARTSGSCYTDTDVYVYLEGVSGNTIDYAGDAAVSGTASVDTTYTTMNKGDAPWDDVSRIYIRARASFGQPGGTTQVDINLYDIAVYADITCAYQHSSGTVPTSESITDFVNALEVFSEASVVNQGTYAIKVLCAGDSDVLNETLTKTITAMDLSATANDTILIDVYAERAGTYFQFGMGEGSLTTYVDVPVAAANTWETVALDFSGMADSAKNAVTKIGLKFTDVDAFNRVYIDNIRTGLYASASYLSQRFTINAGTMDKIYWNENLAVVGSTTYGNVLVYTRTSDTATDYTSFTDDTGWSAALTDPSGSTIASDPKMYFQFKVVLSSTDTTGVNFPYVYKADGYLVKATYWKVESAAESAVAFRWKTGYRNFDLPFADKIFKKVVSVHDGSSGTFDLIVDIRSDTYTFSAISLTTYPNRWVSNFPADMYAPELSLEWYKNDAYDFKVRQYGVIMEPTPLL